MKIKTIYLEWVDTSSRDDWLSEREVEEWTNGDNHLIKSIGFLWKENKDFIVIAQNYNPFNIASMFMKIPKKWILKRKILYG